VSDPAAYHANLQRGAVLFDQGRPREAIPFLQAAIAANPDQAQGYALLARCWNELPSERGKALGAMDRAIGLAPNVSSYFGQKGWIFVCLGRYQAALKVAGQGLELDPNCPHSLNALANGYTKLNQWKNAEKACLRILALWPDDNAGLNLLAQALRHQGRWKESRETVARLLAQLPDDSFGHANAGYGALAAGDHLRANEHFLESLRMDPHFDLARRGLLSSLRARIWIIRFNTRIMSSMQGPTTFLKATSVFIGIALIFWLVIRCAMLLNEWYPQLGTIVFGSIFGFLLLYIYLSVLTGLMGNFLLLFDPLGRHALTTEEKVKACLPALGFAFAMVYLVGMGGWLWALGFTFFLGLLAFSIEYPLMLDRRQRRLENRASE